MVSEKRKGPNAAAVEYPLGNEMPCHGETPPRPTAPEYRGRWKAAEFDVGYLEAIEEHFLSVADPDGEFNDRILAAIEEARADSEDGAIYGRSKAAGRLAALNAGHDDWCVRCELDAELTAGPAYADWHSRTKVWVTGGPDACANPPGPAPLSDEQIDAAKNAQAKLWERKKAERARKQALERQAEYQDALAAAREANEEARFRRVGKNHNATPDALLCVPGFIERYVRHCMATAYSPDRSVAVGGAITCLAALTARKLRSPSNLRTPLFILNTAYSGDGKNRPREINTEIFGQLPGLNRVVKGAMGSGQGVEEALAAFPVRLFQTDEFDQILKAAADPKNGSQLAFLRLLLTINTEANNRAYATRALASDRGEKERFIDTPSLVLLGSCTPKNLADSLTEQMLEGGMFARFLIFHADPEPVNTRVRWSPLPKEIMDEARFWADYNSPAAGSGNLAGVFLEPYEVPYSGRGEDVLMEAGEIAEHEKRKARAAEDNVGCSVWSRFRERSTQLAMLYGASADCHNPTISEDGATWAVQLVRHQIKSMLEQAATHCGISEHEKLCQKVMAKLNKEPNRELTHDVLARRMKIPANVFKSVMDTLKERGLVQLILPRTYRAMG